MSKTIYHYGCEVCGTHITSGMSLGDVRANRELEAHIKTHSIDQLRENAKTIERISLNLSEVS